MRKIYFFAAIIFIVSGMGQLFGQCDMLLWEDNFETAGINTGNWNVMTDNSGSGNNELQYYTPRDTNVFIEDGKLIIRALEEAYGGHSYTSGKLTTRGLADWRYGRIEASIKMPAGQGLWPAFWMMPAENKYGGWPNSGEVDIVELIGNDTNTVHGTIHYGPPWAYTNGSHTLEEGYFSDSAYIYALEWTADTMKWFVDDVMYSMKTRESLNNPDLWKVFQERFYLILNVAVGGNWPGDPDETTVFPQVMEVDYVRVYGDPALQEIIAMDSASAMAANVKYSFTNIPGATFLWSVPEDAVITGGQGTSSITVDWGCNPGDVTLQVSNMDCADQQYTLPVEFAKLKLTGDNRLFPLEKATYQVADLNGTQYTWNYPDNVVEITTPGNTAEIQWGCVEGYVKVEAANSCETLSDSLFVSLREPLLTGPSTVSENSQNVIYKVDPVPQSDFTWSVPSGAAIVSGQGTDSIKVNFGASGGVLSAEIANSCYTKLLELTVSITDTIVLTDYESASLQFETFANTSFEVVENPQPDEVNSSANVAESLKSEVAWAGIYTDLGYNLDMTRHKKFHLKVWGPKSGNVLLKLEDNDVGTVQPIEVLATYSDADAWQNLEFIFPSAGTDIFDRIALFFDFGSEDINTYYFDDLVLLPYEAPSTILSEYRSNIKLYPNPASDHLFYNLPDGVEKIITVYDVQGRKIVEENTRVNNGSIDISALESGVYLFIARVDGILYRELFIIE